MLAGLAAMALALLSGCSPPRPWAEQAVQWIEARDGAAHRSVAELIMFDSADSVHLLCCNQAGPFHGRVENAEFIAQNFGDTIDEETMGRSYIDVSGAVVEIRFRAGPDDDRPAGGGDPPGANELQVSENAADGAATRTIHATALPFLQAPVDDGRTWYGNDLSGAQRLTDRYLSAWSARDGRTVGTLYVQNATLLDSLLGVRLTGRDAIASYAAQQPEARLEAELLGDDPALYGFWRKYRNHLTAYLTYYAEDGNSCPGATTTALQIEQGQIVAERRYHDVASMRRCVTSSELPDGWWTHAVVPPPIQDRVTGTITTDGQRIEVHNGTSGADDLVRWGMARFPAAHLTVPVVASVAFGEEAHQAQCSGDLRGLALKAGPSSRIYLCLTVDDTASPFARELMLHELAHAWMWQNLGEAVQQQLITRMHLPTWDTTDVPRDQRGIEVAAEVIAWGLSKEPLQSPEFARRSCADLAETFRQLTGATPLQPPCG